MKDGAFTSYPDLIACKSSLEAMDRTCSEAERSRVVGGDDRRFGKDVEDEFSAWSPGNDPNVGVGPWSSKAPRSRVVVEKPGVVGEPLDFRFFSGSAISRKVGSGNAEALSCSAEAFGGLLAGDMRGDVCKDSGICSVVSKTKKASPPSPNFIE